MVVVVMIVNGDGDDDGKWCRGRPPHTHPDTTVRTTHCTTTGDRSTTGRRRRREGRGSEGNGSEGNGSEGSSIMDGWIHGYTHYTVQYMDSG